MDVAVNLLTAYGLEYGSLGPIWAGDTAGQLAVRTSICGGGLHKLLPLTDRDAFDLCGPDTDGVLRVARLLDDQPDIREIEVDPGRAPRIAVGPRRGTVDDPWVRRFSHRPTEGSTVSGPDE